GVGKSTLLKIIANLMPVYKGSVLIDGLVPAEAIRQRIIGIKFQKPGLLPWLDVFGNLSLPLELAGMVDDKRVDELLELVGLQNVKNFPTSHLSGGMEQLVSILRSLVLNPRLLLLDEPFS